MEAGIKGKIIDKEQERFYIKSLEGSPTITVYYRPTHLYIKSILMEGDWENEIRELVGMSTEEYYKFLLEHNIRVPREENLVSPNQDDEDWYRKAWYKTTQRVINRVGVEEIPKEEIPFKFIKSMIHDKNISEEVAQNA